MLDKLLLLECSGLPTKRARSNCAVFADAVLVLCIAEGAEASLIIAASYVSSDYSVLLMLCWCSTQSAEMKHAGRSCEQVHLVETAACIRAGYSPADALLVYCRN